MKQTQNTGLTFSKDELCENTPYSAQIETEKNKGLPTVGGQPVTTRCCVKHGASRGLRWRVYKQTREGFAGPAL
jgi:hypothetical protein